MGKKKKPNQHKPCPPTDELEPHIRRFWAMGLSEIQIHQLLITKVIDMEKYGLSLTSFKRIRNDLGLQSTRQQKHTLESSESVITAIRKRYPKAGLRDMKTLCHTEGGIKVTRAIIEKYFKEYEPDAIITRKAKRLKRKRFWAAGVNDIWAIDQHDKWRRFNIWLHIGVEPYSGKILWIKAWWTNKNPKLILNYYLEFVSQLGAIPLVTQSDPGSENYGVANAHTALHHMFDEELIGTCQHCWMRKHNNVKPEIAWSQLRRRFTPGFEDLLDIGIHEDLYDPHTILDILTHRWLFIPYIQAELDSWVAMHNITPKRADRNKILPHDRPDLIFEFPENYETVDYRVNVTPEAINYVREEFAPQTDPVFNLVPSEFADIIGPIYSSMDSPILTRDNIWAVFSDLLYRIRQVYHGHTSIYSVPNVLIEDGNIQWVTIELTSNLQELRGNHGIYPRNYVPYMGGVIDRIEEELAEFVGPNSLNMPINDFSDDEGNDIDNSDGVSIDYEGNDIDDDDRISVNFEE